ncbi:MAG: Slp family lipoprotein, partial [Thermodesulfobacteriota bacterium]|nr:Slp family lipoprotein [Thermodesulfobacteriota bacterium]
MGFNDERIRAKETFFIGSPSGDRSPPGGGKIIKTENKKEGTLIEVPELPLDKSGRPKDVDTTKGRFLALHEDYLDAAIYPPGREVTVIGKVNGTRLLPLGEIDA